jgi:hypothetical protein
MKQDQLWRCVFLIESSAAESTAVSAKAEGADNKARETEHKKQAKQDEANGAVENHEEEQLYYAKEGKQPPSEPPADGISEVEGPAPAKALLNQETGIVGVDIEDTADPKSVIVAIARVW